MSTKNLNNDLKDVGYNMLNCEKDGVGSYIKNIDKKDSKIDVCLDEVPVRGSSKAAPTKARPESAAKPPAKQTSDKKTPLGKYTSDQADRIYDLERENTTLKSKENLLETEIVKMKTKLRRIEELMKKKRATQDGALTMLPEDVQRQLQCEIDKIGEENRQMKERNRKLRAIEKELAIKHVTKKAPVNKFAHVKGKLAKTNVKQSDQEFEKLCEEMKLQLVQGEKQIINLTTQRDQIQQKFSTGAGTGHNEVMVAIEHMQKELQDIYRKTGEIKSSIARDETMFDESKAYIERKQQDINELSRECENLSHKNFQINQRAQQAKELSDDLDRIREERDNIENSIKQITSFPFLKNQSGEPSTQQKVAQMQMRLDEIKKNLNQARAEEQMKTQELSELKAKVHNLKGQNEQVKKQHTEARKSFVEKSGTISEGDVYMDLFKKDQDAYVRAIGDMATKPESEPIWKDYEFLDRSNVKAPSKDEKSMKAEIERMKHENKDFAAELDKTQSLLKLQTDIERENRQYYQQEKERLKVLAQSNELKSQELAKRIDQQAKIIMDMKQALGLENTGSRQIQVAEQPSFIGSADFDESPEDLQHQDDNILDIKIIDGVLNQGMIDSFLRRTSAYDSYRELMTLVSVDFYDHKTRTTTLTPGARPYYDSQISFLNRMSPSYINHLSTNKMKVEVWLAENGKKAILLGSCDLSLTDLVYNEGYGSIQQPVIEKQLNIIPAPGISGNLSIQTIGSLGIKMRLRKPIADLKRFHRDMQEIKQTALQSQNLNLKNNQKIVTISVVKCRDLQTKSSDVTKIAPYFTYQFYTYDEKYSLTTRGNNPVYHDSQTYTLTLDDQAITFLNTQDLQVVFIDDEAPLTGISRGGQGDGDGVDDLIGIARVPLADIAKGVGIDGEFDIRGPDGDSRGKVVIKITVITAQTESQNIQKDLVETQKMAYTSQWEKDIIYRIAQKLSRLSLDVELMFGIFSRGMKTCTKEDFKYCCLQRLNMRNDITEKELDLFLSGNPRLQNKNIVEQKDFVEIFTSAIIKARSDVLEQEAMDRTMLMRYQEMANSALGSSSSPDKTITMADFQRKDAVNTLVNCILNSSYDTLCTEVNKIGKSGQFSTDDLRKILNQHAQTSDFDAQKVTGHLSAGGVIYKEKFDFLLNEALIDARFSSQAVDKFNRMIQFMPNQLADLFKEKDINKDGSINFDGFKGAILKAGDIQDFKLLTEQLKEIFNLLSKDKKFLYAEYIIEQDATNRAYFTDIKNLPSLEDSLAQSSVLDKSNSQIPQPDLARAKTITENTPSMARQPSIGQGTSSVAAFTPKNTALEVAKQKIEQFLISQDVSLSMLFNVIDTNSDNMLNKAEFKHKMRSLHLGLEEEELESLFRDLDVNGDSNISYNEFVKQFTAVNTASIIRRIRRILYGASISAETIFNKHTSGQELKLPEFKNLINQLIPQPKLADFETEQIFNELDQAKNRSIPKSKFLDWFGQDEQEKQFQYGIEDIIKPMATYLKEKKLTVGSLFEKYDQNRNQMLSAKEIANAVKQILRFEMSDEEIQTLHEFFRNKFRRSEVKKHEFVQIIDKKTIRKYDSAQARTSLQRIRVQLQKSGNRDISAILGRVQSSFPGKVTTRNFKFQVFSLGCLTQQEVNNLSQYMDRTNDGLIKISDVEMALSGDKYSPVAGVAANKK